MENTKTLYEMFENGKTYLNTLGVNVQKYIDYYQGKQWPTATENTKTLPRPVFNIIKFVARNKKSGVVNTPVKILMTSEDGSPTKEIDSFLEYIFNELKIKQSDKRSISTGIKIGTYINHFYWDENKTGLDGNKKGGVNVEHIDPRNIVFANPNETDEQKQEWIIIRSRLPLRTVENMVEKAGLDYTEVASDDIYNEVDLIEQEGDTKVWVYTRYYRINGEVYFDMGTKAGLFIEKRAINPSITVKEIKKQVEDDAISSTPGDMNTETGNLTDKFDVYPVCVGNWEEREGSIFGIGEVEELIDIQDNINRQYAYYLKARRDGALGGWIAKQDALEGQSITNAPDQVITDYSKSNDWGIKRLENGQIPTDGIQVTDQMIGLVRTLTGATEVMSGEVLGKNMSGAAIAQLQSQAQMPIEEYRQRFWSFKEKQALILLRFFRLFYSGKFQFKQKNREKYEDVVVDLDNLKEHRFDCVATAGQGAAYNELSTVTALDNLLMAKVVTPEFYIKAMPDRVLGNKEDLVAFIEEEKKGQMTMLMQQNTELQQQLLNAANVITEQSKVVNDAKRIIDENMSLKAEMIKIVAANAELSKQAQQYFTDAQAFAQNIKASMDSKVETPIK